MSDQRKHVRSPIELAASYGMPDADQTAQEALLLNVSEGGFCFVSDQDIRIGTKLMLDIEASPSENLEIDVKVCWTRWDDEGRKYLIGVQSLEPKSEQINRILSDLP